MRLKKLFVMGLVASCLLAGCKNATKLTAGEIKTSTLSVDKKGNVQVAMVESFEQAYYQEDELKTYLEGILADYNENSESEVKMSSFLVENGIASAVFSYPSIEDYQNLNEVSASYLSVSEAKDQLPDVLLSAKDGAQTQKETILSEEKATKYKVLILSESYDVVVEGTILYYSNAQMLTDSSLHTNAAEGDSSVIIYH